MCVEKKSSFPTLRALLLIKETCQLCFPSWAWWDEAGGRTLMRKCGTTSTSRGWLPGTQPETVHTYKKRRGWESSFFIFFWYANLSIMWDFAALDSGSCGRVWRNGDRRVGKDRLPLVCCQLLKPETLIINVRSPTDMCDILCTINKTSKTHISLHYSTIQGCAV